MTLTAARRAQGEPVAHGDDRARHRAWDLERVRRVGLVVLAVQIVCLCVWSAVLYYKILLEDAALAERRGEGP